MRGVTHCRVASDLAACCRQLARPRPIARPGTGQPTQTLVSVESSNPAPRSPRPSQHPVSRSTPSHPVFRRVSLSIPSNWPLFPSISGHFIPRTPSAQSPRRTWPPPADRPPAGSGEGGKTGKGGGEMHQQAYPANSSRPRIGELGSCSLPTRTELRRNRWSPAIRPRSSHGSCTNCCCCG